MLSERLLQFSLIGAEWVLWLLVILSVYSLAIVADRVLLFFRTREKITELEPQLSKALAECNLDQAKKAVARDSFVRNVLRAGLETMSKGKFDAGSVEQSMMGAMARERARYDARLTPLGTIGNNAPFIGLFGTVLGIIQAFQELGRMGQDASLKASNNQIVMGAIGEALVATAVGILVAIPAVAAFNWAKSSIAGRVKNAEALMRSVISGLGNFECREPADS
jgi:biopolymer transport protein ExbB